MNNNFFSQSVFKAEDKKDQPPNIFGQQQNQQFQNTFAQNQQTGFPQQNTPFGGQQPPAFGGQQKLPFTSSSTFTPQPNAPQQGTFQPTSFTPQSSLFSGQPSPFPSQSSSFPATQPTTFPGQQGNMPTGQQVSGFTPQSAGFAPQGNVFNVQPAGINQPGTGMMGQNTEFSSPKPGQFPSFQPNTGMQQGTTMGGTSTGFGGFGSQSNFSAQGQQPITTRSPLSGQPTMAAQSAFGASNTGGGIQASTTAQSTYPFNTTPQQGFQPSGVFNKPAEQQFGQTTTSNLYSSMFTPQPSAQFSDLDTKKGSSKAKYEPIRQREMGSYDYFTFKDICAMNEYKGKGLTEIRIEDYTLGRKSAASAAGTSSAFGERENIVNKALFSPSSMFSQPESQPPKQPTMFESQPPPQPTFSFQQQQPQMNFQEPQQQQMNFQQQMEPPINYQQQPQMNFQQQPTFYQQQPSFEQQQSFYLIQKAREEQIRNEIQEKLKNDPYSIRELKLEEYIDKEVIPKKIFPMPIFRTEDDFYNLEIRESIHRNHEIETIPNQDSLPRLSTVTNLIIIFKAGKIEYLDSVKASDCAITNIKQKIFFSKDSVKCSDPISTGLNKRCRIYINNMVSDANLERFIFTLKQIKDRKFVSYDEREMVYVYEVEHL